MKHVEKFIRHLQSSIEKRKNKIETHIEELTWFKSLATQYYNDGNVELYQDKMVWVRDYKKSLKTLHKQQKTETEMLKWLENIRSCHEEMICAMYGNDTNLLDFTLEESQHD